MYVDSAAIYIMVVNFINTNWPPPHCSSPFIRELRCQAIQMEHGPYIAERTQKAVYIKICLCMHVMFTYVFVLFWYPLKRMGANNYFCEGSRGVVKISRSFSGTAGSTAMTPSNPLNLIQKFHVGSSSLFETPGSDPEVSLRPQISILGSHWNRGIWSCGLIKTAKSELCTWLSWISWQIRSHMRNSFRTWIRALFHIAIPQRALIHRLKPFSILLGIHQEILDNYFQSLDSAVSMRPRNQVLGSQRDRWILHENFWRFEGVIEVDPLKLQEIFMTHAGSFTKMIISFHSLSRDTITKTNT
jgi:hypothetical protein